MAKAKNYSAAGEQQGEIELPESLFGGPVNEHVMHQAVVAFLANQRQGTASTKGRSQVAYTGSKLFRQKGTGRARAGSARSGIRRGGGTIHGPKPRNYRVDLPRKVRRMAVKAALADKGQSGSVRVIDDLRWDEPRTKKFAEILSSLELEGQNVLLVLDGYQNVLVKSARNLPSVAVTSFKELNVYSIIWADAMLFTRSALEGFTEAAES